MKQPKRKRTVLPGVSHAWTIAGVFAATIAVGDPFAKPHQG